MLRCRDPTPARSGGLNRPIGHKDSTMAAQSSAASLASRDSPGVRTPNLEDTRSLVATALDDKDDHMASLPKVGTKEFPAAVAPTEVNVRLLQLISARAPVSPASDVARLSQLRGIWGLSERVIRQFNHTSLITSLDDSRFSTRMQLRPVHWYNCSPI